MYLQKKTYLNTIESKKMKKKFTMDTLTRNR